MTSVRDLCAEANRYRRSVLALRASGFSEQQAVGILANFDRRSHGRATTTTGEGYDDRSGARANGATGID